MDYYVMHTWCRLYKKKGIEVVVNHVRLFDIISVFVAPTRLTL